MKITNMRVNHLENPLGFWLGDTAFSWITEETESKKQIWARLMVAADKEFKNICHDTGETDLNSIAEVIKLELTPRTRYYWRVIVKGDKGDEAQSEISWFETSKINEPWQAKWIKSSMNKDMHPLMQKNFELKDRIKSARVYASGLGLYELYINGDKAGDEVLAPFYNGYDNWLQYQTYDVTKMLREGSNAVGAMLGNGWYKGGFGFDKGRELYGDDFLFLMEMHVEYENGETELLITDNSWMCAPGPVIESGIYLGEHYDARKEIKTFAKAETDLSGWKAVTSDSPKFNLEPRRSPPLHIIERRKPEKLLHTPAGELVLDFGQLMTGWVEVNTDLKENQQIFMQFGELLQEDNFYNENLRDAKQEYLYISNGSKADIRPHFTFYGFRFVKVEGIENINPDDFTACVIHSDIAVSGEITVDNPKLQKLISNALWGQRGNFLDVPTDCPQRDERMGWTGDAQVFAATASFNMETAAFFDKYIHDMIYEQEEYNGAVPHVIPNVLKKSKIKFDNNVMIPAGSCAWGDAATVIPWTLYEFYGDKAALARQYKAMKLWVEFIRNEDKKAGDKRLWETGFHFADWLALDNPEQDSSFGRTDSYFVASCYYFYSSILTAKAAKELRYDEDAADYEKLAEEIKASIQKEYFTSTGRLAIDTQTAHVIALFFDIVPSEFKERTVKTLRKLIENRKDHLDTGFVGTAYICKVLSAVGLNDVAYTLLLNEDYPSWLYEVNMGATTVWERWNSVLPNGLVSGTGMNSMNHYAYGAVVEWMYRYMCGLNPIEPGFKKAFIAPMPDERLNLAAMSYRSASGVYESSWEKTEEGYNFEITVPFGAEAVFKCPGSPKSVYCTSGTDSVKGIKLESGKHKIKVLY